MEILNRIKQPRDLKTLNAQELKLLAREIREEMIDVVSKNGGHLAPNLGVVELTIALHRVFNTSADKIVWDVGHQTYVHKLLTGRQKEFKTLRLHQGLSGFPKRAESIHDCFETGHSSTSISAAVGFAKARDLRGEKNYCIAVIGDGAMTGGMAFEALNHAGHSKTNLIVVLNDNEMAISANVGAMSSYLTRLRTDPRYARSKEEIEAILNRIPKIGKKMARAAEKAKDGLKYLLVQGLLFEELGFTYLGPIDGHDELLIEQTLELAKQRKGPVLVHVITKKGKGYLPAEENPDIFHGVGPFDKETGKVKNKSSIPTFTQVFGETLCRLGEENSNIVAITAAMASGTGLKGFGERFPERFFDVGIAEQHAVTFASALAFGGMKPVVAIYSTFYQRAYDQVLHDVCLSNSNVVLAIDRAGVVGDDGPTHHGIFDISFLRVIPNLTFMAPKDENELQHMLYTALCLEGPVALRYPRSVGQGVELDKELKELPLGKAEVLREGKDVTLIGVGPMVYTCLEAAQVLACRGVEASVINLRFINPLDKETILRFAHLTKRIVTIEDHMLDGGMGSAVLETLANAGMTNVAVERLGYDNYVEQGPIPVLQQENGLSVEGILGAAERLNVLQRLEGRNHG